MYPTRAVGPKFYGLPKIHKIGTPRPIISSRGSIAYRVVKELASIMCPLGGQSPHHLKNIYYFVQHIKEVKLEPGKVMTSCDVKVLFTSYPMDPSIIVVKQKIQKDPLLTKDQHIHTTNNHIPSFASKTHTSSSKVSIMNKVPWCCHGFSH